MKTRWSVEAYSDALHKLAFVLLTSEIAFQDFGHIVFMFYASIIILIILASSGKLKDS